VDQKRNAESTEKDPELSVFYKCLCGDKLPIGERDLTREPCNEKFAPTVGKV